MRTRRRVGFVVELQCSCCSDQARFELSEHRLVAA